MVIFQLKKLVFLFSIMLFAFSAIAQQDHFVYLQTDNGKPFYVRMDKKILSSSSEGYIIIPNITNGVYQIRVGFPKNEYPEEAFTIKMDNYNEGYLIKYFDDKGLQLFNMETLALITGDKDTSSRIIVKTEDNNPFTKMLADVVKDSSILQNHEVAVINPTIPADSSKTASEIIKPVIIPQSDSATAFNDSSNSPIVTHPADSNLVNTNLAASVAAGDSSKNIAHDSPVSKLLSKKDENGLQMIYADKNGEEKDTVRVFMPSTIKDSIVASKATNIADSDFTVNKNNVNSSQDTPQLTITPTETKNEPEKDGFVLRKDSLSTITDSAERGKTKIAPEQVFYIGPAPKNNDSSQEKSTEEKKGLFSGLTSSKSSEKESTTTEGKAANKIEVLPKVVTSSKVNSDCKAFANNEDFMRLRKKMASADNKEDMIKVAKKSFKLKCFSTAQIKDLSFLLLTDEGKYMFFDAAYAHTSDSDQYSTLEQQLKDPYYRSRFEAMVRH